jgi:two-component system response regulator DesR
LIRILVAEHLLLVRCGLLATLVAEPDLRVVAEAGRAEEVVRTALAAEMDVARRRSRLAEPAGGRTAGRAGAGGAEC